MARQELDEIVIGEAYGGADLNIGIVFRSGPEISHLLRFQSLVIEKQAGLLEVAYCLKELASQLQLEWARRRVGQEE